VHARYLAQLAKDLAVEHDHLALGVVARLGDADAKLKNLAGSKSGVDGHYVDEAAQQQAGAQQQRHAQRHLPDTQGAAKNRPRADAWGYRQNRREEREQQARQQQGGQREQKSRNLDVYRLRRTDAEVLQEHGQAALRQGREQQSGAGAKDAEDHSIDEELSRQAPHARAQHHLDSDFAAASQELRQQQVDDVRASDQKQQQTGAGQEDKR